MAWDRADRWTVSGHLCGRELSYEEWGSSSAVLKVTVMPERRLFRLIKSDAVEHAGVQGIKFISVSVSDRPIFYLAYRRIGLSAEYPYRSFTNIYLLTNCGP